MLECQPGSVVVFWDVDAPATMERMCANPTDPFYHALPEYDAILTYGGGPAVRDQCLLFGARAYYSIYNGLDPETHHPVAPDPSLRCDVAFLGNRLPDREARVDELFFRAAALAPGKRFLLGGEGWGDKNLPSNVRWIGHVPTAEHNRVNCSAGMVMNINRSSMANTGFSPPTRVFEVAGAGACLLCDEWPGIDDCFEPDKEILVMRQQKTWWTRSCAMTMQRAAASEQLYALRALREHTYAQRAAQAEQAFSSCTARSRQQMRGAAV